MVTMGKKTGGTGLLRGQIFSSELLVSFSVFIAALIIFILVWNGMYSGYTEELADTRMQTVLIGISDMAVMSPGDPQDWETGAGANANAYGFATERSVLSPAKLYAMQGYFAANYSGMKEKLGAGGYGVFVSVADLSGNTLYSFGSPAGTSNQSISSVSAERIALLGSDIVKLRTQLWRVRGQGP